MIYNLNQVFSAGVVKATRIYEKEISKLLSSNEREKMENEIAEDPERWPVMRGTGGIRKARFSRAGMGKRGGGRVCYLYIQLHETLYFLKAYSKNEQENLSDKEKKLIKYIVEEIMENIGG